MPVEIREPYLLLVEGKDDKHFFCNIAEKMRAIENLQAEPLEGKSKLKDKISAFKNERGFETVVKRIGIVRDSDLDDDPFRSVCDALKEAGLTAPEEQLQLSNGTPQVVVFILPGGDKPGNLEDLCLESVEDQDAMQCIDEYFRCLEARCNKDVLPPDNKRSKAKLHAYLAAGAEPGKPIGIAVKKDYLAWDSAAFEKVRNFIEMLTKE